MRKNDSILKRFNDRLTINIGMAVCFHQHTIIQKATKTKLDDARGIKTCGAQSRVAVQIYISF